MTVLRDISIIWSMLHVLILFIILYRPRYSRRTNLIATLIAMAVWLAIQVVMLCMFGPIVMTQWIIVTGTIPSLIFFFIMSKERDGRFLFTFCLCDTVSAEILFVTNLLDTYLFGGRFIGLLILRILLFPAMELFFYRVVRPLFSEVQKSVSRGWYLFSVTAAIFYVLMVILGGADINQKPELVPFVIGVLVLMPLMYINIFQVLYRQQKIFEYAEKDSILHLQISHMEERMKQYTEADEAFRIERHDMHHKLQTAAELLEQGKVGELKEYLRASEKSLSKSRVRRYCLNPVLDAVLSSYFRRAEAEGIRVRADISLSEHPDVDVPAVSMVLANAIENAIHACLALPKERRYIEMRVIAYPQVMIRVENPYAGDIQMDEKGVPVAAREGHGIGTRSIIAFAEKYHAACEFRAEGGVFSLSLALP